MKSDEILKRLPSDEEIERISRECYNDTGFSGTYIEGFEESGKWMRSQCAKALRKEGYSIREIMKIMKYKSPRSVVTLLK